MMCNAKPVSCLSWGNVNLQVFPLNVDGSHRSMSPLRNKSDASGLVAVDDFA